MTTKIHLAADGAGRPLAFVLTGGNVNDCVRFTDVMAAIRVARQGLGRPRVRPDHVIADKGYSSKAIRCHLRRWGIPHTIPERADQQANRRRRGADGGRPPAFNAEIYKRRNVVERCSTGSSNAARWPPATTRPLPPTRQPSPSPRYSNGSNPFEDTT